MTTAFPSEIDTEAFQPFHRDPPDPPVTIPPAAAHGIAIYSPEAAATMTVPPKLPHIDQFFHDPAPPPSVICPQRFPGIDPKSTDALIRTLTHNHLSWHIFFNYKGFHNHAAHHLLCIWSLGANGPVIDATYATHYEYQRPAFESPGHITHGNFRKHLGDERYYSAYLVFFKSELLKKGLAECLEEFVLSSSANFDNTGEHPAMLSRFTGGVFHPFIHVGYGAEFDLFGISAEGLAMAAVHPAVHDLVDRSWFPDIISEPDRKGCTRNALTILSLIACDPRFSKIKRIENGKILDQSLKQYGPTIREYVEMWKFDITSDVGISDAIEELSWVNTMIYGVSGHLSSQEFRADFFLMHLLTSSLFLPSLLPNISKFSSRRLLLMTYFFTSLMYYVGRGRPKLDLRGFYRDTEHLLHRVPGTGTSPARGTLPDPSSDLAQTPNTWLPLIQSMVVHPNEHLCKAHRALAHYSSLYGVRRKGWAEGLSAPEGRRVSPAQLVREEEVTDKIALGELDGTLFLRVAMLTQNRLGWMREGEPQRGWDFDGFYVKGDA
ncbi:hypothetical protein V8B97DRAFT_1929857 [Scleroderma yunnanense]